MEAVRRRRLEVESRRLAQDARLAIRDVYDAIVEMVTNADDRYQILNSPGCVEIEVGRRKGRPSTLRVRDFADGMTTEQMNRKLGRIGGRVSGMEEGHAVRGTNSRGAKDIAALGPVTFESISRADGRLHTCRIFPNMEYESDHPRDLAPEDRERLGIANGAGTVVTIDVDSQHKIPQIRTLVDKVASMVQLRDIVWQGKTRIVAKRLGGGEERVVRLARPAGKERVNRRFTVHGYDIEAKIRINRARKKFDKGQPRFRLGGVLVKSRHAIHEATLFDPALERDTHAQWFFGRLTCEAIDDLWNDYDECEASGESHPSSNPVPILDPSRRSGLTEGHPFVQALYKQAASYIQPLVDEERTRQQRERARVVESDQTRKRLNALEKVANQFMTDFSDEEEASRSPSGRQTGSRFQIRGYTLSPSFKQVVLGATFQCRLTVLGEVFPELGAGAPVGVECATPEILVAPTNPRLERLDAQEGALRATWSVTGRTVTPATGLTARVGPIEVESTIAVVATEADLHADVRTLQFGHARYRIAADKPRKIKLMAPEELVHAHGRELELLPSTDDFKIAGHRRLVLKSALGIAIVRFRVSVLDDDAEPAKLIARLGDVEAETELRVAPPTGAGIVIKLEDVDHGALRYRWNKNVLEVGARHPSLKRYLGDKADRYPGQDQIRFRVLLAEVIAEALCVRRLEDNIDANPGDYNEMSWKEYYDHYSDLLMRFLPKAHEAMVPGRSIAG